MDCNDNSMDRQMSGWSTYFDLILQGHKVDDAKALLLLGQFRHPNGDFRDIDDGPFPPADGTEDYSKFKPETPITYEEVFGPDLSLFPSIDRELDEKKKNEPPSSEESVTSSSSDDEDVDLDDDDKDDVIFKNIFYIDTDSDDDKNKNEPGTSNENKVEDARSAKRKERKKMNRFFRRLAKLQSSPLVVKQYSRNKARSLRARQFLEEARKKRGCPEEVKKENTSPE